MADAKAIKIAINALGGQGGGVLANWIVRLGESAGYVAQMTSVPGVAQRTGATVYYIELFSEIAAKAKGRKPVLALMPVPGDVDVVIASELMEAGRAIARGFVSKQTTLIASSHRDYAIGEKIAMGDGRLATEGVVAAAEKAAGRFIIADMAAEANEAGAVISAVLFGALSGSGALPIPRAAFEATIKHSGRALERNLAGFDRGFAAARTVVLESTGPAVQTPTSAPAPAVLSLIDRLAAFPANAHPVIREGLKRVVDFQDVAYGSLYLDRLDKVCALDDEGRGSALLNAAAKHLALWMSYEDAIRVADLKTRASRFARFREDARARDGQIVHVSEYMHPRVEEVCDLLPSARAEKVLASRFQRGILKRLIGGGRRVSATKLRGFLMLSFLASLKPSRRSSYRYAVETKRIEDWLALIEVTAPANYNLALEIAGLQGLLKGYGDTHERGLGSYRKIVAQMDAVKRQSDPAAALKALRDAALKDEEGVALDAAIGRLAPAQQAA